MVDLEFVDQHNMVACLERTDGNAEFHQIVDFLTTSLIHYALIVKPTIYASYIEKFWATAKSKTVNDVKRIHATVDGKTVIDLAEPFNDVYITPVHTKKVFTNMKRQIKDFLGTVTPLFSSMFVPQVVEGEGSGQPFEPQPPSSTAPLSHEEQVGDEAVYTGEDDRVVRAATTATSLEAEQESGSEPRCQDTTLGDADAQTRFETASKQSHDPPFLEVNTSGSREDCMEHQDDLMDFVPPTPYDSPLTEGHTPGRDEDLSRLGDQKPVKESQKIGKEAKGKNFRDESLQGYINDDFDDIIDMVKEAMKNVKGDTVNAGGAVNTTTTGVSAASASVTTAGVFVSTAEPRPPPTTTTTKFEDEDLTISQTLVKMRSKKAKEKGVAFRDVEESARPTTSLPTIDPKDKGKGIIGKKDDSSSKQAGNRKKRAGSKLKLKSPKKLKVMKEQDSTEDEQEKRSSDFV
uniref:Xylulose kinase-1 n=1 Tax=Tanacetum cinerariifolium TaxID=118510 RepID=A0A6L2L5K6_TANCI|nr:hypothetical protein [Tanacetum cinerariifolium]